MIGKTKNVENVPSLEIVKAVLVKFNLVDNQYQQKSEVLYISTFNKSFTYLLHMEPSNLGLPKTCNTMFDEVLDR